MARKLKTEDLLLAMLTCRSQKEAAEILGVTEQTICKRIKENDFKEQFSKYRKQIIDNTSTRLVISSQRAVDVLVDLLDSESEITRYNASAKILQITSDYVSLQDIILRLDKLEQDIQ